MGPILFTLLLTQQSDQKPNWHPSWPCSGKERAFDPVYLQRAEATGGQLFLFDRSEVAQSLVLITADGKHPHTAARAVGTLEQPYLDLRVPIDASVDSLLITATLQCMKAITIYDPASTVFKPQDDHYFRAGRIAIIPNPRPGVWTIRFEGAAHYSLAAQVHSKIGLDVNLNPDHTASVASNGPNPRFKLIDAAAANSQSIALNEDRPGQFTGTVISGFRQFRLAVEGVDDQGYAYQRVCPRLIDWKP